MDRVTKYMLMFMALFIGVYLYLYTCFKGRRLKKMENELGSIKPH